MGIFGAGRSLAEVIRGSRKTRGLDPRMANLPSTYDPQNPPPPLTIGEAMNNSPAYYTGDPRMIGVPQRMDPNAMMPLPSHLQADPRLTMEQIQEMLRQAAMFRRR